MEIDWRHQENWFNPAYHAFRLDGRRNDDLFEDFAFRLIWKIADEKGLQGRIHSQDIEKRGELLPREVIDQLNIRSDTLLNVHAYEAYTLLSAASVDLENLLERHTWSVFDRFGVNLELAGRLWEAGFRDVNEIYEDNETCLTKMWRATPPCPLEEFLQKAHWLISKGADVHHQGPSGSALHTLGKGVGSVLHYNDQGEDYHLGIQSLSDSSKALLRIILFDNIQDDCECACSLNGFSPLTALLAGLFPKWTRGDTRDFVQIFANLLTVVLDDFDATSLECYKIHVGADILRFITFRSLDLTHTCLHEYRKIEPEEVKEIHSEENLLILDLVSLLKQFAEEFRGTTCNFRVS
jgi:hypothetical protein